MRSKSVKDGFTLVEILVAVTLIVTIVSMVYGSYLATAKSTEVYKAKMTVSSRTRKVLRQMAQQIRCSYVGKTDDRTDSAETISEGKGTVSDDTIIYFNYEPDVTGVEILHLVTTNGLFYKKGEANGLFDVAYKFDKDSGTLSLSQRRFVGTFAGTTERFVEERNWRPLVRNVEGIDLDFIDGHNWMSKWEFKQKRKLPVAVEIGITSKDKYHRQGRVLKCHYDTIVYVGCSWNHGRVTRPETLLSVSK